MKIKKYLEQLKYNINCPVLQHSKEKKCPKIKQYILLNMLKYGRGDLMYKETFSQKLKKARENTGFTQEETALETGIPRSTLANYEAGRTEPDIENLGILADFYEVSIDWLVGTKGEKNEK